MLRYVVGALIAMGCGASPTTASPTTASPTTAAPTNGSTTTISNTAPPTQRSACEEHLASLRVGPPGELAADDPLRHGLHYSRVFLDRAARESDQTKGCCEELLAHDGRMEIGCCSVTDAATQHPACLVDFH